VRISDGVLWPRDHPGGSANWPVVLLEVQMHPDRGFRRRLRAETFRLLQQQEQIEHLRVVVLLAHRRLNLGSPGPQLLRRFLEQEVTWVDLELLASQSSLDPGLALLSLPVRRQQDLAACAEQLIRRQPDWIELILPILCQRFMGLSPAQIMATFRISPDLWRHTRAFQDTIEEGRREGRDEGRRDEASALALRLLERRCGSLSAAITARIVALELPQLEELALALLDFSGPQDLGAWLEQQPALRNSPVLRD
jgi:predicted transposase YdaD